MERSYITEGKIARYKVYYKYVMDENGVVVERIPFVFQVIIRKKEDGKKQFIVLDQKGNILEKPYKWLNDISGPCPNTTKKAKAHAVKYLYHFAALRNYDPECLTKSQVSELIDFLMGYDIKAEKGCTVTYRTPRVVNGILSNIRTYLSEMDLNYDGFMLPRQTRVKTFLPGTGRVVMRLKTVKRVPADPKASIRPVKHITPQQMKKMAELMVKNNDDRSLLLSELQYGYGFRQGEAQGLTEEDVICQTEEGEQKYSLILRNRLSDREDQFCKNLPHPTSKDVYNSTLYQNNVCEVPITEQTYNRIQGYIKKSRNRKVLGLARVREIEANTLADSVEGNSKNHYIFVGKNNKPLSGQTWNNILKRYFAAIGIPPDRGSRYYNCSHRLRHGFAMFWAHYCDEPVRVLQLMKMMRHRSVSSTTVYYNLPPEAEVAMRDEMNEKITKIFDVNTD